MSHTIPLHVASADLPGLIRMLKSGDEVVLIDADQEVATITVPKAKKLPPISLLGAWKGKVEILDDSDDVILEHFKDYLP